MLHQEYIWQAVYTDSGGFPAQVIQDDYPFGFIKERECKVREGNTGVRVK